MLIRLGRPLATFTRALRLLRLLRRPALAREAGGSLATEARLVLIKEYHAMSQDIRISELPEATALTGDEALPLVQSAQTRLTTVSTRRSGFAPATHTHPANAISDTSAVERSLLTADDPEAQRTALGLGSLATQAASSMAVPAAG